MCPTDGYRPRVLSSIDSSRLTYADCLTLLLQLIQLAELRGRGEGAPRHCRGLSRCGRTSLFFSM